MPTRGEWRPILHGADAERARAAIAAVADDLDRVDATDASLSTGHAGCALLHAYRARDGEPGEADRAAAALERAAEHLGASGLPWLYMGYPGVAWALQHLSDIAEVEPGALDDLDAMILEELEPPWTRDFELVHGLTGLGIYGLERGAAPAGAAIVDRVLEHLAALAVRSPTGPTWPTRDRGILTAEEKDANPGGVHDLGVAHGTSGVVGFLAMAARLDRPEERALLDGAVRWLLAQGLADGRPRYLSLVGEGLRPQNLIDGWCYGDPGVAAVLVLAGLAAGEPAWVASGRALMSSGGAADPGGPLDFDVLICHGTAGRAHLLNRVGQTIGDDALVAAARRYYLYTLEQWMPGNGYGGFVTPGGPRSSGPQIGWQMGSAGVGLALLAAVSPVEPAWD